MKIMKKTAVSVLIAGILSLLVFPSFAVAEEAGGSVEEAGNTITSLVTVQERLDAIEAQKGESEAYLAELDSQLNDLTEQLTDLQEQYSAKRTELDTVSAQLADAEQDEERQRENMALRIQYMYENSTGNGLLNSVFSTDGFQDILTRAANIRELSEFDRKMLEQYEEVCREIEEKRSKVEKEQAEIKKLEDESVRKRSEIQTIYEETQDDIREMAASIEEGHEEEARLLASIQQQESQLAVWFVSAADEVAAADSAAAGTVSAETAVEAIQQAVEDVVPEQAETEAATAAESTDAAAAPEESAAPESTVPATTWEGSVLTRIGGVNQGPSGKETYYNLNMSGVINIMRNMGNTDQYWVRDDGVKMLGDYVMVAADLETHERGSIVESSLGQAIVVDTGCLEKDQLDIATCW